MINIFALLIALAFLASNLTLPVLAHSSSKHVHKHEKREHIKKDKDPVPLPPGATIWVP